MDTGKGRGGEPSDVCVGPELARLGHGHEAGADTGLPAVEPRGQHGPDAVVTLTELAEKIGDRTAALTVPLLLQGGGRMPLTIREQSERLQAAAAERLPAEVLDVFDRSTQDLLHQGIPADSIKAGDSSRSPSATPPAHRPRSARSSRAARRSSCSIGAAGALTATLRCAPTSRSSSPS